MMENRYSSIADNVKAIREKIAGAAIRANRSPGDVKLMAVTKTRPPQLVNAAIEAGVDFIGENRAQELLSKYGDYRLANTSIHFIGSLQRNKVRQIIDKVDLIQSVDSVKLAEEIDKRAAAAGKIMDVLIEVNIGGEESKSGARPEEAALLAQEIAGFSALRLRGIMTIPPFSATRSETERFFYRTRQLFIDISGKKVDNSSVDILSMGMSDDFELAILHGSTLCRIGGALFN
jgi:pyridoxal phosphate enzyme (YggS family)